MHCQPNKEQKLAASDKYARINQDQDPVELLKLTRSITNKHKDKKGGMMVRVEHDVRLYMCFQKPSMSNVDCYKTLKAIRAMWMYTEGECDFMRESTRSNSERSGRKVDWVKAMQQLMK